MFISKSQLVQLKTDGCVEANLTLVTGKQQQLWPHPRSPPPTPFSLKLLFPVLKRSLNTTVIGGVDEPAAKS